VPILSGKYLLPMCLLSTSLWAGEIGHLGPTYPIIEEDALLVMQRKLQHMDSTGQLQSLQRQSQEQILNAIESPAPISGITEATSRVTHYIDPTLTLPQEIKDHTGRIVIAAGSTVNPLEHMRLSKRLVFFDGRDALQAEKVKAIVAKEGSKIKAILVAGSFMATMRAWGAQVYFDQYGKLVRRFNITQVPTIVSQDTEVTTRLKVEAIPTEELQ